jgi:hypothetical protein
MVRTLPERTFKRVDEKEERRIEKLAQTFESGKPITRAEVFDSEIIPKILEGKPLSFVESFHKHNIAFPLNCLLFQRILVTICPGCDCNSNPELIKPYLERKMILPILTFPLSRFETNFADLIVQYPYIGAQTFSFLRNVQVFISGEPVRGIMCPHCFEETAERILKKMSAIQKHGKKIDSAKEALKYIAFPSLYPTRDQEAQILEEIEDAVDQKNIELLPPLVHKADIIYGLRASQIFNAIPQVAQKDLFNIAEILRKMELPLDLGDIEQTKEKKEIVKALNMDYNSEMPVENYLDIILPRREKINSLLNELISGEEKDQQLSKINDAIWKINEEISSSKAIETFTFLTNFVSDNAKILFGMMLGGLIGYSSASFAGCGLGSVGGLLSGIVGKSVSKHMSLKVPKYPKKTIEWIKKKIESPEERLLATMLSKDIKVIQTWALRKKLQKM